MDIKLIASTFFILFLAELGDKTQFAAIAASAGSNKPLSILIGAVLALTISSIIAVAAGSIIGNIIPIRYIKIAAGVLFLIFGIIYIKEGLTKENFQIEKPTETTRPKTLVINVAKQFELQELDILKEALKKITNPETKAVIEKIIQNDTNHFKSLNNITGQELYIEDNITNHQYLNSVFTDCHEDNQTLKELILREEAMADFYRILSEKTKITSAKKIFKQLYYEEKEHSTKIHALIKMPC